MWQQIVNFLRCIKCNNIREFKFYFFDKIQENGILICNICQEKYIITDKILIMLNNNPQVLEIKKKFCQHWSAALEKNNLQLSIKLDEINNTINYALFIAEEVDNYDAENIEIPFRQFVDKRLFNRWQAVFSNFEDRLLLDIGCGTGRATDYFAQNGYFCIGCDFDVNMLKENYNKAKRKKYYDKLLLIAADATNLPFATDSFNIICGIGLLHHLNNYFLALQEAARILKKNGVLFFQDNNDTPLRFAFDLLIKIKPLWHDAGVKEPLINGKQVKNFLAKLSVETDYYTEIFIPPHLYNLLNYRYIISFFGIIENIISKLPILKNWGGLIFLECKKK